MSFNENTRVKIPAILHLCRLGYAYLPLSAAKWDEGTNIFTDIFAKSIRRLNPDLEERDVEKVFQEGRWPWTMKTWARHSTGCSPRRQA